MNPRQRRGALLTVLAALSALVAFFGITGYVGSIRAEVGQKTRVLMLTEPVKAYSPVTPSALRSVEVPRRWTPRTMITNPAAVSGMVASADLARGSYLQQGMLVAAPELRPGQREVAILIDAETGVAGKVRTGMRVDVYAAFEPDRQQAPRSCAIRVISGARVVETGTLRTEPAPQGGGGRGGTGGAGGTGGSGGTDVNEVVPVTFALSPEDSLKLTYAESFATKVRLALIGQGEDQQAAGLAPVCKAPIAR